MGYSLVTEPLIVSPNRMLVMGPPNSGKTESGKTWPRPTHHFFYPGERGEATAIGNVAPDYKVYKWTLTDAEKMSSGAVVTAVETLTWEILGGKYGPVTSFIGDGIHKYYGFILDWITGGSFFKGEEFDTKLYARSHEHFIYYVQRIAASLTDNVAFLCWDGQEPDTPGQRGGPSHTYPDFPGKMAKRIMGEFGVVVYAEVNWAMRMPGKAAPATWQLIPEGKVWGAGIKVPLDVVLGLPIRIEQSFPKLVETLDTAWKKAKK